MKNEDKIILDLCGGTGSWSRPYKEAGYNVRVITLPEYDVCTYIPPDNVYGVLAATPCTEFSVLNCKAEARERKPEIGMIVVTACLRIIAMCRPRWWAMENPAGTPPGVYGQTGIDLPAVGVRRPLDKANGYMG